MRAFLHIGAEKTGTSSLQQFFRLNRKKLKSASILYSEVAGAESHTALAAAAEAIGKFDDLRILRGLKSDEAVREFRGRLSQALTEEALSAGCENVIFSSEHLSSRLISIPEIETLANMLRRMAESITVVVYLRRQDDFLCSTYSTDVKSGFTGPMTIPGEGIRQSRYNYYALLERWTAVFGRQNIVCRIYEKSRLKNGDLVDDFAELIGLPVGDAYERPARINESLDVAALEFLRLFNAKVPKLKDDSLNPARGNIVQTLQKISHGPGPTLPEAQLGEFMRFFERSNRKVALEYFGAVHETGDPLFGEADFGQNRALLQPLTAEKAIALAAGLWERKQEQTNRLMERIGRLQKNAGGGRSEEAMANRRGKAEPVESEV